MAVINNNKRSNSYKLKKQFDKELEKIWDLSVDKSLLMKSRENSALKKKAIKSKLFITGKKPHTYIFKTLNLIKKIKKK